MPPPNAIYHHLRRVSKGLSRDNIEAIFIAFPEVTFEELSTASRSSRMMRTACFRHG